jgi:hypothetical protein
MMPVRMLMPSTGRNTGPPLKTSEKFAGCCRASLRAICAWPIPRKICTTFESNEPMMLTIWATSGWSFCKRAN